MPSKVPRITARTVPSRGLADAGMNGLNSVGLVSVRSNVSVGIDVNGQFQWVARASRFRVGAALSPPGSWQRVGSVRIIKSMPFPEYCVEYSRQARAETVQNQFSKVLQDIG